jgi:hypothetical protein
MIAIVIVMMIMLVPFVSLMTLTLLMMPAALLRSEAKTEGWGFIGQPPAGARLYPPG